MQNNGIGNDLEARLRRLEDLEAIRHLKARYFFCCDRKDADGMRDCFVDGCMLIDYGALGSFDNADAVVQLFRDIGCQPHMVEMHHGANHQITLESDGEANGLWSLHYFLIDTSSGGITQLGGYYEDRYAKIDGRWKMSATRFVVSSTLVLTQSADALKPLFAGRSAPAPH